MAGDASNAAIWANADVLIAPVGTAAPTNVTTAWSNTWSPVGLLDPEAGFTEDRNEDVNKIYAWGGLLVKTLKSKHERTIKFTALESNQTIFNLVNPGSSRSTAAGLTTSTVKVPSQAEFAIAFETRDGSHVKRRIVKRASIESVGTIKESESEVTIYELTVSIYPESDGTLYVEYDGSTTPASGA